MNSAPKPSPTMATLTGDFMQIDSQELQIDKTIANRSNAANHDRCKQVSVYRIERRLGVIDGAQKKPQPKLRFLFKPSRVPDCTKTMGRLDLPASEATE